VTEIREKALHLLLAFIKITPVSQSHKIDKYFDTQHIITFVLRQSY